MKIVINTCYGGFGLSHEAYLRYAELVGKKLTWGDDKYGFKNYELDGEHFWCCNIERNDPHLVQLIEEMISEANGRHSELKVVEIPDDIEWFVEEYDGREWVAEKHQTWS